MAEELDLAAMLAEVERLALPALTLETLLPDVPPAKRGRDWRRGYDLHKGQLWARDALSKASPSELSEEDRRQVADNLLGAAAGRGGPSRPASRQAAERKLEPGGGIAWLLRPALIAEAYKLRSLAERKEMYQPERGAFWQGVRDYAAETIHLWSMRHELGERFYTVQRDRLLAEWEAAR